MKKTVLTVLCAAMLLGMTAIPAHAAASETVYVSIADDKGALVLPYRPVTVTDIDGDGALTINDALYAALLTVAEGMEVKNGRVLWPVRIAITGTAVTPGGATEIAELLGREETLARLDKSIAKLQAALA